MKIKLIKTNAEYEAALERVYKLMGSKFGSPAGDELELLSKIVEWYEQDNFPIGPPTPLGAIQFRMDQAGLKPQDLVPYLGSRSKVSEVLSGKRSLSLSMIRSLHKNLGIPLESLISEPPKKGRAKAKKTKKSAILLKRRNSRSRETAHA